MTNKASLVLRAKPLCGVLFFVALSVEAPRLDTFSECFLDNMFNTCEEFTILERLREPGYPVVDQDIVMKCAISCSSNIEFLKNVIVNLKYQYLPREVSNPVDNAWKSIEMAYQGLDKDGMALYEGIIPRQRVGYICYYYQVESGLANESSSLIPETASILYWDNGETTTEKPLLGAKFQVRPYRSRFGSVTINCHPASAYTKEMTLVGDNQWQSIIHVDGEKAVPN